MTVYYVNSLLGSDKNAGTSENSAFNSLSKVESLKLKPGDTVLLAAGSEFREQFDVKWSGKVGAPITISSYGNGPAPVITGGEVGVYGSKTSHIVLENVAIKNTLGGAMYAGNASDWVVRNVQISDTGSATKSGSLTFQSSQNIVIENSTLTGVHSDGIWMRDVNGVQLLNNTIINAQGPAADSVQINDGVNLVIRGNVLQQLDTDSAKGVLALVRPTNAIIEGNTMVGGGFGIGAQGGQNIQIHDNEISHFGGYTWSYGIGLGDHANNRNYDISGNYIHDGVNGVLVSSVGQPNYIRDNINIHNNVFDDLSKGALQISRAVSGSFHDNIVGDNTVDTSVSSYVGVLKDFAITGSKLLSMIEAKHDAVSVPAAAVPEPAVSPSAAAAPIVNVKPIVAHQDAIGVSDAAKSIFAGNLLSNDHSDNGTLLLRRIDGQTIDKNGVTLVGKYGTLHVESDGDYTYALDYGKIQAAHGKVSESFQYKVSDGTHLDSDSLVVKIDAELVTASHHSLLH